MNSVNLVGRLGQDPKVGAVPSGSKVATLSLGVKRKTKEGETTDWFDCVSWGKNADVIEQYVKKGDRIGITGTLQTRSFETANGEKRKVVEVLIERLEFLSDRKQDTAQPTEPTTPTAADIAPTAPSGELPFEI